MLGQNTVYAEIYFDNVDTSASKIVVPGTKPATGYTVIVTGGTAKAVRWKYCPPQFTDYKQTCLRSDPAIALTSLLHGSCNCGFRVKDFASVVMGHKKDVKRNLVCPLCRGTFQVQRCNMSILGDDSKPENDVVFFGPYAKEAYDGLLFNAKAADRTEDMLQVPTLWFGYKPSEAPDVESDPCRLNAKVPEMGMAQNKLKYLSFDSVRAIHLNGSGPSVRSIMLESKPKSGKITMDDLSGSKGKCYSWCLFRPSVYSGASSQ